MKYIRYICYIFTQNKKIFIIASFLVLLVLAAIIFPFFSPYDYYTHDLENTFLPPMSQGHLFGTDEFGRDLFTRIWYGVRISVSIGLSAAILQTLIGVVYGGIAAIVGGIIDEVLMRLADILYAIPYLIVVVMLSVVMGKGQGTLIIALALTEWMGTARLIRAEALQLKQLEFVQAARVLGMGHVRILFRHILPNCRGVIIASMLFCIPSAIFAEAFLSFLGMGIELPKASLGTLASDGYRYLTYYPWLLIIPMFFIGVSMLLLNILGDELQKGSSDRLGQGGNIS